MDSWIHEGFLDPRWISVRGTRRIGITCVAHGVWELCVGPTVFWNSVCGPRCEETIGARMIYFLMLAHAGRNNLIFTAATM